MKESAFKQAIGINRNDWRTPSWFFEKINSVFDFQVDGASDGSNNLLPEFHTEGTCNGIRNEDYANRRVFINPPFNQLSDGYWFQDVVKQLRNPDNLGLVAILCPVRPETRYWHELVWPHATVFIPNKRINYVSPITGKIQNGIAVPSGLLIYGNNVEERFDLKKLNDLGVFIRKRELCM